MTNRKNVWIRKAFDRLEKRFGGKCSWPGCEAITDLEFAHIKPTELSGWSRGRKERYYDIIRNPGSYRLLCKNHHKTHDDEKDYYKSFSEVDEQPKNL